MYDLPCCLLDACRNCCYMTLPNLNMILGQADYCGPMDQVSHDLQINQTKRLVTNLHKKSTCRNSVIKLKTSYRWQSNTIRVKQFWKTLTLGLLQHNDLHIKIISLTTDGLDSWHNQVNKANNNNKTSFLFQLHSKIFVMTYSTLLWFKKVRQLLPQITVSTKQRETKHNRYKGTEKWVTRIEQVTFKWNWKGQNRCSGAILDGGIRA